MTEEESIKTNGEIKKEIKKSEVVEELKPEVSSSGENVKIKSEVKEEKNVSSPELEQKIIEQVEYYFSDYNLPRDKFLQQQIKLDDGWVPLDILIKFNRLAKLSTDITLIAESLLKSTNGLVEVNEDKTKIRRNPSQVLPEMNEARRQELMTRTLYVGGFPQDEKLDKIQEFFAKYGKVDQIVMRKYQDKAAKTWVFKGSVFAVFPKIEDGQKFLDLKELNFGEKTLKMKWQNEYVNDKRNERLVDRLNKKHEKNQNRKDREDNEEVKKEKEELAKGTVLFISGCPEELTREDLKTKIEDFGIAIAFIDYTKGNADGYIRLQEAGTAEQVIKMLEDGKLEVLGTKIDVRSLEGEEEVNFLIKVKSEMAKKRNQSKHQHKRKGGRREGGGGHWRKRKGSPTRDEGESPSKKIALSAD